MHTQRTFTWATARSLSPFLYALLLGISACLAGCSGSSASSASATPPVIASFYPSLSSINAGSSSTLNWVVSGATSVSVSGISGQATSPLVVTPTATTTYTLTATNSAGSVSSSATITVLQPPVISSFTATPASVPLGMSSSLAWSVTAATSVSLTGVTGQAVSPVTVTPSKTTTYTLTATNAAGSVSAPATVTVTVALPVISAFSASPASITAGQPVTLTWTATGAASTQISGVTSAPVSPAVIYPSASATYTLTVTNASGSASKAIPVTVSPGTVLNTGGGITVSSPGVTVPANFMGLSIGSNSYAAILGEPATGTNHIYRQLLANLTAFGSGPIVMRIGGSSADSQDVPTAATISSLAQLATDSNAKFILGVSLAPDVVSLAQQQATAFTAGMPAGSIVAAEIGNEPDLYVEQGLRTSYTNAQYLADFANFRAAVLPIMQTAGAKVTGPAWSSSASLTNLPSFLTQESANLALVTQHQYGGTDCNGATVAADYLLQETAQAGAAKIASGVAPTHAAGLPYRLAESNSISCSGQLGVSNTYQAALWSLDWMARLAAEGVDGINFFGNNDDNYSLFIFNSATSQGQTVFSINTIRPQYDGLVLFQQATQNSARFLPISYTASGNQRAYAWLDAAGNIRVLVLNKDEAQSGTFAVSLSGYGAASVIHLTGPNYASTSGVILGGQTLDGGTDGSFVGNPVGEVVASASGVYTVAMPAVSAALVTIPHN
jgi:PKD repeat protein